MPYSPNVSADRIDNVLLWYRGEDWPLRHLVSRWGDVPVIAFRRPRVRLRHQILLLLMTVSLVSVGISTTIALHQSNEALIEGTYDWWW